MLLATFLLTIFYGLTEGIVVGFAIGAILFINRMAEAAGVETHVPIVAKDKSDDANGGRAPYDVTLATDPEVVVYRISGVFFFGAASMVGAVLDNISDRHKAFVIDFSAVPFLDSTAANTIEGICRKAKRTNLRIFITGTTPAIRRTLFTHGVKPPAVTYKQTIAAAVAQAHR